MPMRAKYRPPQEGGPRTPSPYRYDHNGGEMPDIEDDDCFRDVVKKLSLYITDAVTLPSTFEQLRTTSAGDRLRELVQHLSKRCTNPAIVNALLALKWHYGASNDEKSLSEARAYACEIVAWRFLTTLSEREAVDYCLYEIPDVERGGCEDDNCESREHDVESGEPEVDETTGLLSRLVWGTNNRGTKASARDDPAGSDSKRFKLLSSLSRLTMSMTLDTEEEDDDDPCASFSKLNALEIAAVADAKRFLGQNVVQKIITGIWNGDIIFWDSLAVDSVKKPRFYNPATADVYSRLRVPKYLKSFEVVFFGLFLALYYSVLVERNPERISFLETLLYLWFVAFTYDELSEWIDAGSIFYAADVWNLFDMVVIAIGFMFAVLRIIGLSQQDTHLIDLSFDVLALEALFIVPRICSILSLSPYWGTLIPCLKEMGKDFFKFMVLVVILYLGFLTTFSLVGRDVFSLSEMTMVLTKIFFGSSYVGFDIMDQIDPVFGPPLMLIFVTLSSILLMGSLTGMLSNSFSRVISHAREEYLYVYSIYVLEASTSNRLTHFYPPFNLLALVIFRPLRLFLPSDNKFRAARILLLKATHWPIVGAIQVYELVRGKIRHQNEFAGLRGPRQQQSNVVSFPRKPLSSLSRPSPAHRHSAAANPYPREGASGAGATGLTEVSRLVSPRRRAGLEDDVEVPTNVEVQIAELHSKIDKLTDLVIRLQAKGEANVSLG